MPNVHPHRGLVLLYSVWSTDCMLYSHGEESFSGTVLDNQSRTMKTARYIQLNDQYCIIIVVLKEYLRLSFFFLLLRETVNCNYKQEGKERGEKSKGKYKTWKERKGSRKGT